MSEPTTMEAVAPTAARRSRGRSIAMYVVLVLAGLLLLLTSFAVWVDRVALNTDVFVDTSAELIEDDAIRNAVAQRAVDELFESVDVKAELREQLPDDYQRLSGPAAAGLREVSYRVVDRALEQPRLQRLWARTLEESHRTLVAVLEGDEGTVSTAGGVVTLDLERIVLETAERIGLRDQVEDNLPEDVGRIEILRSDELDTAQDAFQLLKVTAWLLPLLAIAAFVLAAWVAGDRRRAVRRIGITVALVGLLGLVAVNVVGNYVVNSLVAETDTRIAAGSAWDILTHLLRVSFRWFVAIGILFVVASWLAGPGRRAVATRRFLAPVVRERVWAYAGLAVIALILLLTGAVGDFTRFLAVVTAIALGALWIEVMRRQTFAEYPNASGAALLEDLRTRVSSWWKESRVQTRAQPPVVSPPPTAPTDVVSALASLSDLHARGELTDAEFAAAKARVLSGE